MLPSNASDWERTNPPPGKSDGPRAGLFVTIGLLVVLIGVIAFAVTRLPTGTLPSRIFKTSSRKWMKLKSRRSPPMTPI
jgi:hypothetical protein